MQEKTQAQKYMDELAQIIEGKARDCVGNPPDDADRLLADGIALVIGEIYQQDGPVCERIIVEMCERFFGDRWPLIPAA